MKRSLALWLGLLLACGGDPVEGPPDGSQSGTADPAPAAVNRPPRISEVTLSPLPPKRGDRITLAARVEDPDRDRVSVSYEWFVNRVSVRAGSDRYLETEDLGRGDEIYALVRASDGTDETMFQTPPTRIENSPPEVTRIRILPEKPSASDSLLVEVEVEDADGDPYEVAYTWIVNDEPLAGATAGTLEAGRIERGDRVVVRAIARDPDEGPPRESDPVEIQNAIPEITSTPTNRLAAGTLYRYQIQAKDPDGDRPLRYDLAQGPDGMSVDFLDGLLEWNVPDDANGTYTFEVSVRDPYGGEARQSYSLELRWTEVPAKRDQSGDDADSDEDEGDAAADDDD